MNHSFLLAIVISIQLFAAFITQVIILRNIGPGVETDIFVITQSVSVVVVSIIQAGLQSIWMPELSRSSSDPQKRRSTLSKALGQAFILAVASFCFLITISWFWVPLFLTGGEQILTSAIFYFIGFSISSIFTLLSLQLTLNLRATGRFILVEGLNSAFVLASLIVVYIVTSRKNLDLVLVIIVIRSVLFFVAQMKVCDWPLISIKKGCQEVHFWRKMLPVIGSAGLYKTSPLVDRYWAAQTPAGGVTLFNFAQTAVGAISTLLERSICVPASAGFGAWVQENKFQRIKIVYRKRIFAISLLVVCYVISLIILRPLFLDISQYVLNISVDHALQLWWVCILLSGYLHVAASGTLPVAILHALNDTKTPVIIGVCGFFFSLVIKALAFIYYDIEGLVLSTSFYYIGNMILMVMYCEKRLNEAASGFYKA